MRARLDITPPAAPTEEEIARFNSSDAIRAAVLVRKAGLDVNLARGFLSHQRYYLKSEAEVAMVAHLAEALGDTQMAVRIGKTAIGRGMNLVYYAYPIHSLPAYTPLRQPPEPAVIFGIARQESEFNSLTMSGAGARGILQVMPVTAKHVCRDYKLKCDIPRLMKDPAYNTMLGSAYISDRMAEFSGSYVLTLAGYNAGPGRAREWIKEFGDPRDGKVDPIDWIHRIPFEETREYVQKVLSNIQVYRARLGEANAVRLNADLKRVSAAPAGRGSAEVGARLPATAVAGIHRSTGSLGHCCVDRSPLVSAGRWIPVTSTGMTRRDASDIHMQNWIDIHYTSRDGLRLYARHYPVPGSLRRPAVCLAGLTRNCPRLPRPRQRAGAARRDRPRRLLPRLSRARALAVRSQLEELLDPGRAQRRTRLHGHEGPRPRRRHRHLARRADRHADGACCARMRWAPSCSTTSGR